MQGNREENFLHYVESRFGVDNAVSMAYNEIC